MSKFLFDLNIDFKIPPCICFSMLFTELKNINFWRNCSRSKVGGVPYIYIGETVYIKNIPEF
jgi:hypothetical protein